ncbi:hypothetical protein, partial [Dechloromonas sp. ZS-1]|uniref:hypothetical protein n=1 Tax=Dechloromonas sp. ZS-1 TaxID=3138067 RepID=UPI0031FC77CC
WGRLFFASFLLAKQKKGRRRQGGTQPQPHPAVGFPTPQTRHHPVSRRKTKPEKNNSPNNQRDKQTPTPGTGLAIFNTLNLPGAKLGGSFPVAATVGGDREHPTRKTQRGAAVASQLRA